MEKLTTLLCLIALTMPADAGAQGFDVAGQLGLLNRNHPEFSDWDQWYSSAAIDATAGRYWTPHFKTEVEIGTATEGHIDGQEGFRYREHRLRESTLGATALYQFLDNQWVHPFIGAGVELARERHFASAFPPDFLRLPPPAPGLTLTPLAATDMVSYSVRPVVSGGFKFYVTPRAFVRTEVRTSFDSRRPLALRWSGGVGFDISPARPAIPDATDTWRTFAEKLDTGTTINVALRNGQRFKATFIAALADGIDVQRKTRDAVAVETIPYNAIAALSKAQRTGMSGAKVAGIALGSAGATLGALFLIMLASLD